MRRTNPVAKCPIERSAGQIGDAWTFLILRDALYGEKHFVGFRSRLKIASNVLSDRLTRLVDDGIMEIHESPLGNSHEYHLTQKGRDLHTVMSAIRQWGVKYLFDEGEPVSYAVEAATGETPPQMQLVSNSGRVLGAEDLQIVVSNYHSTV